MFQTAPEEPVRALLPEGDYTATITDLEKYDSLSSGSPYIKISLDVQGHFLVFYQACGPTLRMLVLDKKDQWIGTTLHTKVEHHVGTNDQMYHNVLASGI